MSTDDGKSNGLYKEAQLNLVSRCYIQYKCVTMESRVLSSIPSLGFTSKNDMPMHVWYLITSLVFRF